MATLGMEADMSEEARIETWGPLDFVGVALYGNPESRRWREGDRRGSDLSLQRLYPQERSLCCYAY